MLLAMLCTFPKRSPTFSKMSPIHCHPVLWPISLHLCGAPPFSLTWRPEGGPRSNFVEIKQNTLLLQEPKASPYLHPSLLPQAYLR